MPSPEHSPTNKPTRIRCNGYARTCRNKECRHWFRNSRENPCPDCGRPRDECEKLAVPGYKYCRFHGGPNPTHGFYGVGPLMTGETSHFPLTRLAAKYNQMQTDGRIMSNRASLEIIRTRITQLLERIDMNEAPDRLAKLAKLWQKFRDLDKSGNHLEALAVKVEIDAEFDKAYHDYQSWKQMFDALDLDRKMVESEVKIAKDIQAILTAEDAYELAAKLLGAIISTVNSMLEIPQQVKTLFLKRIQYEFTRIVGDGYNQGTPGSGGEVIDSEPDNLDREGIPDPGNQE